MARLGLSGEQSEQLANTILSAYSPGALSQILFYGLDRHFNQLVSPGPLRQQVFELVTTAEQEGWTSELISTLRAGRPSRPEFAKLSAAFGLEAPPTDPTALERMVSDGRGFRDPEVEARGLFWTARQVGRIEVRGVPVGTGFLIGPDLVLTNYHVVLPSVADGVPGSKISLRLDHRRAADGLSTIAGTEHPCADGFWLLASGAASSRDEQSWKPQDPPSPDALDFAVLRLVDPVGVLPVEGHDKRGWIDLTTPGDPPKADDYLMVYGFPGEQSPLVYDGTYPSMIDYNSNQTRMRYRTNTDPGMSGSPVLDRRYKIVALHNAADPSARPGKEASYNVGVPIQGILSAIASGTKQPFQLEPNPQS